MSSPQKRGYNSAGFGFGYVTEVPVPAGCAPSLAKRPLLLFPFVRPHNFLIMQVPSKNNSPENENQGRTQD